MFSKLRKNRKGITMIILSLVVALVALAILIPVGLMIQSSLTTITKITGMSATANATVDTVNTNIYSAFNLVAIVPIIAGAAVIISVIMGAFAFKNRGQ
jgi:ABC-type spermidine/putrescine transport system permease subunit II